MITARTIDELRDSIASSCVTIGNFDGVHLGHQRLLHRDVAAQVAQLIVGDAAGHLFGGGHLNRLADKGPLADIGHRQARHESARLWHDIDQTFGGKFCHRIGNRAARDTQTIAYLGLADDFARAVGQRQDGLLQALIDALPQ